MTTTARTQLLSGLTLAMVFVAGAVIGVALDRRVTPALAGTTAVSSATPLEVGSASASGPAASDDAATAARDSAGVADEGAGAAASSERRGERQPMYMQLDLSDGQESRIDSIVEHYRERVRQLRSEARRDYDASYRSLVLAVRDSIKSVLEVEQAERYDELLKASDERRAEERRREDEAPSRRDEGSN
jgi:Spy/CpxP family protein refolding chaperone